MKRRRAGDVEISARQASANKKKPGWRIAGVEDHWLVEDICPGAGVQISEGVAGRSRCTVGREFDRGRDRRRRGRRRAGRHPRCCVQQGRAVARTGRAGQVAWLEALGDRDLGDARQGRRVAARCRDAEVVELASGQSSLARRRGYPGALFGHQYRPRGSLRGGRPRSAPAGGDAAATDQCPAVDGARLCPAAACRNALSAAVPGFVGSGHDR